MQQPTPGVLRRRSCSSSITSTSTSRGPYNGYTALHDAIWQNNVEVAKVLIDAGANLTLKAHSGETPLDFARAKHASQIVAMIEQKLQSS